MFGWKSKEQIRQELLDELRAEKEAAEEAERLRQEEELKLKKAAEEEAIAKIKAEEEAKAEAEKAFRESAEPWVEVKGIVPDPEKGIKLELDWNDAFIKYLRDNGYKGADDNAIIQQYIAELARNVAGDMAEEKLNEFE